MTHRRMCRNHSVARIDLSCGEAVTASLRHTNKRSCVLGITAPFIMFYFNRFYEFSENDSYSFASNFVARASRFSKVDT